jgi:threonine dehydrogenase-like Zn-dependent dehydrogenase
MSDGVRAMVLTAPGDLALEEFSRPAIAANAGLLRVEACGLCGSDLEFYSGKLKPPAYPVIPGHEAIGRIEEIGDKAAALWNLSVGDRVAVEPVIPCWACKPCRSGRTRACVTIRTNRRTYSGTSTAVSPSLWGGYAEYMYLDPGALLHRVPIDLPIDIAVMVNPLANGIDWSVLTPGTGLGDTVVILGPGQRGLMSVAAAKAAGAAHIVVTGLSRDAHKLALALQLGADAAVDVETQDVAGIVREITGGEMADCVVDTTPMFVGSVDVGIALARDEGALVLAGTKGGKPAPFDIGLFMSRKLRMYGCSSASPRAFELAADMLAADPERFAALHTHSFELTEAVEALDTLERGDVYQSVCVNLKPGA